MPPKVNIHKDNQILISLAVRSKLISTRQEQEILSILIEIYNVDPDYQVVELFKEKKILTQEKIKFLFALKNQLKIKMLDKRFGEIGVSNRFVSPENVEKALNLQDTFFRERQKSKKIGDILVETKKMSQANRAAILLTQDRIEDNLLEQSIYEIATTEIEKMTINKRLGAVAVKNGFISIEQLNQALRLQKQEFASGKKRYLGEILKELFKLNENDILFILKIQQQIEIDLLSLEKAVKRYKSEINSGKRLNELFDFTISKNKMEAYVLRKKEDFEEITLSHFHNWLKLNGIRFGVISDEIIKTFLSDSEIGDKFKIAEGKPFTKSVDEKVQLYFNNTSLNSGNQEQDAKNFVKKGTNLAETSKYQLGETGSDVMGNSVSPPEPKITNLMCGPGVSRKGLSFIALQDGIPLLFNQRTIMIKPYLEKREQILYTGHIQNDTKEIYNDIKLKVEGNISSDGIVNCHDLSILGNVIGIVDATGDVNVRGKIGENESFIDTSEYHTIVWAGGNIKASKNIYQAKVIASKEITAPKSDVFYSELYAMDTILLNNVHSSLELPSILQIGSIPNFKIDAINRRIDEETSVLRTLQKQDEIDVLDLNLRKKIEIQNEYLERQNILNYLIKICDVAEVKHIISLEQKIQIYEPSNEFDESAESLALLLNEEDTVTYLDKILSQVKELDLEKQKQHLARQVADVSNLYQAAINNTERYTAEHQARYKFIMKKVTQNQSKVTKQKQKIEKLITQKDYLLSQKKPPDLSISPMIRVKNMVEKNTIIKGRQSSMVINETVYGVRIREVKDLKTDTHKILIDGYYD